MAPRGEDLRIHGRMDLTAYQDRAAAMPLGLAAGIPEEAVTCDVVKTLRNFDPLLSTDADDPDLTLLDREHWLPPRRPYVSVDYTRGELVSRAVDAGLVEHTTEDEMIIFDGKPRHGGTFSVPKEGQAETRWIAPSELASDFIDDKKVPPTATHTFAPIARARVSKRDARHCFHSLRTSRRRRPFHAIPPNRRSGLKQHVRLRSWAMGCKLSATLAQGVSNAAADAASIPLDRRLLPGNLCPGEPCGAQSPTTCGPSTRSYLLLNGEMISSGLGAWWTLGMTAGSTRTSAKPWTTPQTSRSRAPSSPTRPSMRLSDVKEDILFRGTLLAASCYTGRCVAPSSV